jgi:glucose-6-phosphate-specific signal transduction histidine kinase
MRGKEVEELGQVVRTVYRIVAEAVTNAVHHAAATRCSVSVSEVDDDVVVGGTAVTAVLPVTGSSEAGRRPDPRPHRRRPLVF